MPLHAENMQRLSAVGNPSFLESQNNNILIKVLLLSDGRWAWAWANEHRLRVFLVSSGFPELGYGIFFTYRRLYELLIFFKYVFGQSIASKQAFNKTNCALLKSFHTRFINIYKSLRKIKKNNAAQSSLIENKFKLAVLPPRGTGRLQHTRASRAHIQYSQYTVTTSRVRALLAPPIPAIHVSFAFPRTSVWRLVDRRIRHKAHTHFA